jgi:polyisoprenoid-binding protein YceI
MKKTKFLSFLSGALIILVTLAFVYHQSVDWKVKDGYSVKVFRNSQLQYPIFFKGLKAEISFDQENPGNSTISAVIDATTVDTGNPSMTAHAKEPNVLDTDKFPEITFKSTAVKKATNGYEITGNLTLKGITKKISFPFTFEKDTFIGTSKRF